MILVASIFNFCFFVYFCAMENIFYAISENPEAFMGGCITFYGIVIFIILLLSFMVLIAKFVLIIAIIKWLRRH